MRRREIKCVCESRERMSCVRNRESVCVHERYSRSNLVRYNVSYIPLITCQQGSGSGSVFGKSLDLDLNIQI